MSFVSALKTITNKINSMAKAMDSKVETFADQVLGIVEETNADFFAEADREEFKNKIKNLFSMFDQEEKKPKSINGYILFSKENREACLRRNDGVSPKELTKKLGEEWQALDKEEKETYSARAKEVSPQTKEEKKAKRAASKSPKVKPAAEPVAEKKKSKSKKVVEEPVAEPVKEKKEKKSTSKKSPVVEPVVAPVVESVKDKLAAAEKKMEEAKAKAKSPKSSPKKSPAAEPIQNSKVFNFKKEDPVVYTENPEFWKCVSIKLDGTTKNRLHKATGLVLDLNEAKLIGRFVDGKATMIEELNEDIKEWSKKCGISVGDEDMDIELDEELESEDEE